MTYKLLAASASLIVLSGAAYGAPSKPAPAPLKTGVLINAITRNESPSKVTLQLAEGGQALLPIVISDKASDTTKLVAAELKKYLDQMSGARFEIKTGDGSAGIVLGNINEFPVPALNKALEVVHSFDGKEAYAIRTRDNKVLLLGATDLAVSHAAYRFLEELGCRWFFPDATGNWQVIPKIASLKFNREITDRPACLERRIWYAWGVFNDAGHPGSTPQGARSAGGDYSDWARRNSMAGSFTSNTGHAYDNIVRENAKAFEEHPEYFALVKQADGTMKRQGNQLELGNPGLRKLVVDWAVDFFKKNPTADMVSVDPADGGGVSESEEAKAYGNASDSAFKLANEVAVALQKAYPGQNKMVGLYAYNWHSDPPPFALEPNVYIQLTMGFNGGLLTLDELFQEWPKKAKNLGFYDYYSTWRWDFDRWPGGRVGSKNYPVAMIRRFQEANARSGAYATSISAESSNNWGVNGRGYYLANKLMWNPDLDADAVLQDFYDKAFGPAAAAMKKYYSYQDSSPPISPGVIGALFRAVREASTAAKDRPDVQRRLDDIKNYLNYEYLNYRMAREPEQAKKDAMLLQIWTNAYRARYSYMNHWEAIRQDWVHEDPGKPDDTKPWKVNKPITHDETEALFQEALAYFPELKVPDEVKFSEELVAVDFGGKGVATSQNYQEGSLYAVMSVRGEPIHIKIEAGGAYGGLKQTYQITDAKGKVLKEGKPKAGEKIEFDFPVPAPGVYYFHYHDHGAYGSVFWNENQIVSLPMSKLDFRAMSHVNDMYFYVPKGTKEINYYYRRAAWQFGGAHQISDPTGKVVKEVAVDGDYVSIPVAAGTDGKVWKIGGPAFGLGYFRFFDVPNYFSPNPNKMLLPRDVVQKDGLKVLK
ncbi:MAG TPA: DUF4838 domain-containing protein [Abditibacteriaceae bacterium]|nr:DUF4838 domain-containing protein [Abditibacteriaceae bacterium]